MSTVDMRCGVIDLLSVSDYTLTSFLLHLPTVFYLYPNVMITLGVGVIEVFSKVP